MGSSGKTQTCEVITCVLRLSPSSSSSELKKNTPHFLSETTLEYSSAAQTNSSNSSVLYNSKIQRYLVLGGIFHQCVCCLSVCFFIPSILGPGLHLAVYVGALTGVTQQNEGHTGVFFFYAVRAPDPPSAVLAL